MRAQRGGQNDTHTGRGRGSGATFGRGRGRRQARDAVHVLRAHASGDGKTPGQRSSAPSPPGRPHPPTIGKDGYKTRKRTRPRTVVDAPRRTRARGISAHFELLARRGGSGVRPASLWSRGHFHFGFHGLEAVAGPTLARVSEPGVVAKRTECLHVRRLRVRTAAAGLRRGFFNVSPAFVLRGWEGEGREQARNEPTPFEHATGAWDVCFSA